LDEVSTVRGSGWVNPRNSIFAIDLEFGELTHPLSQVVLTSSKLATRNPIDMAVKLLTIEMNDGSRRFGELPQTVLWHRLRRHIEELEGAEITGFITDNVTEAWIDFSYRGHRFSVNDQFGAYWFFVDDPQCPDEILEAVLSHCESLLTEP
jgi:hypothetical protein